VQEGAPLDVAMAPADDFVRDLVGANDMLRRLSMLPVSAARLAPVGASAIATGGELPTISAGGNLRAALGLLLQSGAPALVVVDDAGAPVGRLDFAAIRSVLDVTPAAQAAP
jgi:osmoprotectant transport system ATP-binding protein